MVLSGCVMLFFFQVSLVGSGNWGTAVGKIVAANAKDSYIFQTDVRNWGPTLTMLPSICVDAFSLQ